MQKKERLEVFDAKVYSKDFSVGVSAEQDFSEKPRTKIVDKKAGVEPILGASGKGVGSGAPLDDRMWNNLWVPSTDLFGTCRGRKPVMFHEASSSTSHLFDGRTSSCTDLDPPCTDASVADHEMRHQEPEGQRRKSQGK